MKDEITLTFNYQECLLIRHCLESYADKWVDNIRELTKIANCEYTSAEIKDKCTKEIREIAPIRISTQKLWEKVSHQMHGISNVPAHLSAAFKDPEEND